MEAYVQVQKKSKESEVKKKDVIRRYTSNLLIEGKAPENWGKSAATFHLQIPPLNPGHRLTLLKLHVCHIALK